MAAFLCVCTSLMIGRRTLSEHRFPVFRGQGLFAHPGSCKSIANCSRNMCMWLGVGRLQQKLVEINLS